MIPENMLSSMPVVNKFQLPKRERALLSTSHGGSNIGDTDIGESTFVWNGECKGGVMTLWNGNFTHVVHTVTGEVVRLFDFTFTQNMSPVLTWQTDSGSYLKYYNTVTSQDEIIHYPNSTNMCVKLDELRPDLVDISDVIVSYQKKNESGLFIRYQRDRYLIEYKISNESIGHLNQTGMMDGFRFGWSFTNSVEFKFK